MSRTGPLAAWLTNPVGGYQRVGRPESRYVYFVCQACNFSAILTDNVSQIQLCPRCTMTTGKKSRMTWRYARPEDKPTGKDPRDKRK